MSYNKFYQFCNTEGGGAMPTYPTIELSKRDLQKYVDTVQQAAAVLNSVGLDVTRTMDNMRDINRALPKYFK